MSTLWVSDQSRRYTMKDLLADAKLLGASSVKPRTVRTFVENGLLDHPTRDWHGRGGGSSGGWWPRMQFNLWHAEMAQSVRVRHDLGRKHPIFPGLFNVPVAGWLYFGDTGGVHLSPVRRAMGAWLNSAQIPSLEAARRAAANLVRIAAHPDATGRLEYRRQLADMMQSAQGPDRDELLYIFQQLIDPHDRGVFKGPPEAPLEPENLADLYMAKVKIMRKLRDTHEQIPDGLWEWARFVILWGHGWYQETQPRLANDPSVRAFPELQTVYHSETFETLVNSACDNLLTTLGMAEFAKLATHMPMALRPEPWLTGKAHLAVEFKEERSLLVSPIGWPTSSASIMVHLSLT